MSSYPVGFHEHFPCTECGYACCSVEAYEKHLIEGQKYSKRKAKASVTDSLWRHSMCRDCWNDKHKGVSSVGHEVPERFRQMGNVLLLRKATQRRHQFADKSRESRTPLQITGDNSHLTQCEHARYYWLLLGESYLTQRLFGSLLGRGSRGCGSREIDPEPRAERRRV